MDTILETIEEALLRTGLSAAAASKLAVGHPSLIKNMRMDRTGDKRYNLPSLVKLGKVLGLEFYYGPRRDQASVQHVEIDATDYAHIPIHDAYLSAGPGSLNSDPAIIDHLVFRHEWLRKIGLKPEDAALARVSGDSMAPGITSGDLVMIDKTLRDVPARFKGRLPQQLPIFAFMQGEEARVKRLERLTREKLLVLYSDNKDIQTEILTESDAKDIDILGKVVWWGHTVED